MRVQPDGADAEEPVSLQVFIVVFEPQPVLVQVAGEELLRQGRPIIWTMRFTTDNRDVPVKALVAQGSSG